MARISRIATALVVLSGLWMLVFDGPAVAIDFSGSLQLWTGPVTTNDLKQDQLDQRYALRLKQEISPWLNFFGAYRFTDFRTRPEDAPEFSRSTSQPSAALVYERTAFSARLAASDRQVRSTIETQNLDVRSYLGQFEWRPSWGPRFFGKLQEDRNTADPAVFGRETRGRRASAGVFWDAREWNARYTYDLARTENLTTGLSLDQEIHEVLGAVTQRFWGGNWLLSADGRIAYLNRELEFQAGTPISQPVPVTEGLFAINTAPEIGELLPNSDLIDMDFQTPVTPSIDIGGANTFRNIGVDLGITRPISQLEISVDRVSGAGLDWLVYASPDNLNWFLVSSALTRWDGGFLRYTLEFPETDARFFKAVNISLNPLTEVLVTEIRALVEVRNLQSQQAADPEGWINTLNTFTFYEVADLTIRASVRRDAALALGGAGRQRDTEDYSALLRIRPVQDVEIRLDYRTTDLEEDLDPFLKREEQIAGATLDWNPLTTLQFRLNASNRIESEFGDLLRDSNTLLARVLADPLPDLELRLEWLLNQTDDNLLGYEQSGERWTFGFRTRPFRRFRLDGSVVWTEIKASDVIELTERLFSNLGVTWTATTYLSFSSYWTYSTDNLSTNVSQRHNVSWTPGTKLVMSLGYRNNETIDSRKTTSLSGTINYKLNRWARFWFSANDSATELTFLEPTETTSLRFGVNVIF